MQDHETLLRNEFSRQADAMSKAALFNDENVLARIVEAAQPTGGSRVLDGDKILFDHTAGLNVAVKR